MSRLSEHAEASPLLTPLGSSTLFSEPSELSDAIVVRIPVGGWLPVILAVVAIVSLVMIRPRASASVDVVFDAGVAIDRELAGADSLAPERIVSSVDGGQGNGSELAVASPVIAPLFTPEVKAWESKISRWSEQYGLDPNIIATIMQIESCGDPSAQSFAGARGLFQVMPFHFAPGEEMNDPDTNAMRGMAFFNEQLRYTSGDILLSFAGYNGGYAASGGSYDQWPAETQRYYYWAKGIYEDAINGAKTSPTLEQWLAAGGAGGCQRAGVNLGL